MCAASPWHENFSVCAKGTDRGCSETHQLDTAPTPFRSTKDLVLTLCVHDFQFYNVLSIFMNILMNVLTILMNHYI